MAGTTTGKVVQWRQLAFAGVGSFLANFGSLWFLLAPLLAAYAPRRLFQTYFNLVLRRHARRLLDVVDPYINVHILEPGTSVRYSRYGGPVSETDGTFEEVQAYLSGTCSQEARELRAEGAREGDGLVISMRGGQEVADEFRDATFWWASVVEENRQRQSTRRCHRLTFHRRHRQLVIDEYLPHVRRRGREILFSNRRRRLYTNNKSRDFSNEYKAWSYMDFDHPTTFDTLAMDLGKKREIIEDLDAFRENKDLYRRTGKPWKRGYLLYGPPGTGKSTMIAAMANYLDYDIYDVELTVVGTNHDLRKLLIETTGKSIIVIEDIDCSLDLTGKRRRKSSSSSSSPSKTRKSYDSDHDSDNVTLSGLLNFIDGLWSACGGERIVVFTTNHVDKLDPALIRRGRMDMHIEMSYCGAEAFRTLAKNYLGIVDEHELFAAVDEILREVELTPADVSECLVTADRAARSGGEPSTSCCLGVLIDELKKRAEEKVKAEAEAEAEAEAKAEAEANKAEEDAEEQAETEAKAIKAVKATAEAKGP